MPYEEICKVEKSFNIMQYEEIFKVEKFIYLW